MHPLVIQVEKMFLPELERLASEMRERYPSCTLKVWSSPTGSLTDYQGHDVGVEFLLQPKKSDRSNDVVLNIDLCHLTSTPRVTAAVSRGSQTEAAFKGGSMSSDCWPEATEDVLQELVEYFPTLVVAFKSAVERGVV